MVELTLAPHTALCNSRAVARRAIVFSKSLPGRGSLRQLPSVCLWRVSVEWASLGFRVSQELPARLLPLPRPCLPTCAGKALANGRVNSAIFWGMASTNSCTEREVVMSAPGFAGPLQRALKYYTGAHGVPPSRGLNTVPVYTQGAFIAQLFYTSLRDPHSLLSRRGCLRALMCLLASLR